MIRFLISATFWNAAVIRGKRLLDGGAYSGINVNSVGFIRGRRLFETQHLLKEIR